MYSTIKYEKSCKAIAHICMDRPDTKNAFNAEMIAELTHAIETANNDNDVRIILLAASGNHFSAGADINWMKNMATLSEDENRMDARNLAILMRSLFDSKKVTLAQVQGAAFGGALGLISCCDIAIASQESKYCFSEVKLGLLPAVISPYVINAIGERAALNLFLTAEIFNSNHALRLGLIHAVAEPTQLSTQVSKTVNSILNNGPSALVKTKQLVRNVSNSGISDKSFHYTIEAIANARVSVEGQEGLQAFLEKRTPNWQGI